jgi:hypothetical protein
MDLAVDELRGATFDDLEMDWRNGIALVGFLPSATRKGCRMLRATGVTRVSFSRSDGASALVKDVRCSDSVFELTMESGETLRIEAAEFAVSVTTAG